MFSVQAQSLFLKQIQAIGFPVENLHYVYLFLRQYLCLGVLVLAVTAGLEECGKRTIYGISMPMSLSGAVIGKLFYIIEGKIRAFSVTSSTV